MPANISTFDQFVGGAFAWFMGVIEDVMDPKQLGRVRVRCFGYHTDDKNQIPTASLPWATMMTPVTSASMSGTGLSSTGSLQGSWVVGFFRDGPSAQDPVILGTIPSNTARGDPSKGFSDPSGVNPVVPGPDIPLEATSNFSKASGYVLRVKNRQSAVVTANGVSWNGPDITKIVAPVYPKNQAFHSESGHVLEIDDTPGAERLLTQHKTGTAREIDPTGSETVTVVGSRYTAILGSDNIVIKGTCNVTINGDANMLVKGNYNLEVTGNRTVIVNGNDNLTVGQARNSDITGSDSANIGGDLSLTAKNSVEITSDSGDVDMNAPSGVVTANYPGGPGAIVS